MDHIYICKIKCSRFCCWILFTNLHLPKSFWIGCLSCLYGEWGLTTTICFGSQWKTVINWIPSLGLPRSLVKEYTLNQASRYDLEHIPYLRAVGSSGYDLMSARNIEALDTVPVVVENLRVLAVGNIRAP